MIENKEINRTFEKYPEYKDSGVEWLGEIPSHWEIRRMASLGRFSASGIDKLSIRGESLVKIINYTDVYKNSKFLLNTEFQYMTVTTPESNRVKHLVEKGDLIFLPSSETFEDLGLSALVDEDLENVSFSYHVLRFRFNTNVSHRFKRYLLNNPLILNEFSRKGTGSIRKTLSRNDFRNTEVVLPPYLEQTTIANFLDDKTSKIDTAIAQKEQMIALLKERKQIVIQNAVTGKWSMVNGKWGETPKEKIKDSGVEWIGEIPEGWEVKKLKYVIKLRHGHQFRDNDFTNSGVKIVKITQLHPEGYLDLSKATYISSKRLPAFKNYMIKEDDVLMCLTGGTIGKIIRVQKVNEPLLQNYRVGHFSSINESVMSNDYMFILLSSKVIEHQILFGMIETGQPNIGMDDMKNMIIVTPNNTDEQNNIVSYINNMSFKIDQAITLQQSEIEKLKEYKATLIDGAVTGKIKVS